MTIRYGLISVVFLLFAVMDANAQAPQPVPPSPVPKTASDSKNVLPMPTSDSDAAPKAATQGGTSAIVLDISAIQGLLGKDVRSYAGDDMGHIVDCLVTPTGQARAVVIDYGGVLGVGSRKVAVDWKTLDFSGAVKGGPIILGLTRNEVRVSPEYKVGDPVVVLEAAKPDGSKTAASAPVPSHSTQAAPVAPLANPKKN